MKYVEKAGNLFDAPNNIPLAHCVSKDLKMSKGIAVMFKQKFGKVRELYEQNPEVGSLVKIFHKNRPIFYLVTKR